MEKVAFELFGLALLEPLSSVTNWIMASQCFYFYNKLESNSPYQKLWRIFFLLYGFSFIFGGISHLFFNYLDMFGKIPGWSCALIGITAAEWAMTYKFNRQSIVKAIRLILVIKLILISSLLIIDLKFLWVMLHITGLLFFVCVPAIGFWSKGNKVFRYFVYSIGILLLSAPIKLLAIDIHPAWFNRDDIGHVFMIMSFWMMFKAVKKTS